jgi:tRNA nucleotidyltransferase (CCA-adding enzyme)
MTPFEGPARNPPDQPGAALSVLESRGPAVWAEARPVLEALRQAGFEAWLVGGLVRDLLLGLVPGAPDLATDATPEEVIAIFPQAIPTGIRHGTVTVMVGSAPVEITTFRVDTDYSDARRPDQVTFVRSIEEDVKRRDFTINALAWDPVDHRLVDGVGGLPDLNAGLIRAVGDPGTRFREDGLRPFRAVRLAVVLGFDIEGATLEAIPGALPQAARVAPERVRDEMNRMLAGERPSHGLELMRQTGLLALVLPEVLEGYGVWQNRYHAYDVYQHTLAVVDAAPRNKLVVRLAALLHDIGKPRTKVVVDGEGTFYNHQHVGAEMARAILTRLRYPREMVDSVSHLVDQHMFHYQSEWTDAAVRRFVRRVGPDRVADLFDLRLADTLGNGLRPVFSDHLDQLKARVDAEIASGAVLTVRDLALSGRDVMEALSIPPGPQVGKSLEYLLDRVLEDPTQNNRPALLQLLKAHFREKS